MYSNKCLQSPIVLEQGRNDRTNLENPLFYLPFVNQLGSDNISLKLDDTKYLHFSSYNLLFRTFVTTLICEDNIAIVVSEIVKLFAKNRLAKSKLTI